MSELWAAALTELDEERLVAWLRQYADKISTSKSRSQAATEAAREVRVMIVDVHRALQQAFWAREAVEEIEKAVAFFEGARASEPVPPRAITPSELFGLLPS